MKKNNWKIVEKATTDMKRKIKNIQSLADCLGTKPEPGYFVDNLNKKTVKITECKDSTLRRYIRLLDKYYFLVTSPSEREFIKNKKIEIETELEKRGKSE